MSENSAGPRGAFLSAVAASVNGVAGVVTIPELGGHKVHVRRVSMADRVKLIQLAGGGREAAQESLMETVRLVVCDDAGRPLFGDTDEDRAAVASIPALACERIAVEAARLNSLRTEDIDAAKKPSPTTRS